MNWSYQARQMIKRAEATARINFKNWEAGATQDWRDYGSFFLEALENVIATELELVSGRHP